MDTASIRKTFLDFYTERGHTPVPSSSLVPDDPTLLFTSAGMVQFKPYLLGDAPPFVRAVSLQKCMRAGGKDSDLEMVGKTTRHLCFFEMLGNFSFGDYFKEKACPWAWEVMTDAYGLDADRLWVTIYEDDDDAAQIWTDQVGVELGRIIRRGKDDNFWSMGVAGPCGPCSEILYDRGPKFGEQYVPGGELDDERYLEIYNLVFMQNMQDDEGNIVGSLPKKNIDTGLGLGRLAMVLQNVPTIFDTDVMRRLIEAAEQVTGKTYGADPGSDVSLRVIAEHARAVSMLIADGVLPSNESRGYVLRRLIRRAIRYARLTGLDAPFLEEVTRVVVESDGVDYPELRTSQDLIAKVVSREEKGFDVTLRQGLGMLEEQINEAKIAGRSELSGDSVFKLHDTYGFPLDITVEIAEEEGIAVDLAGFDEQMRQQRDRARSARKGAHSTAKGDPSGLFEGIEPTRFDGYEHLVTESKVLAILESGVPAEVLEQGREGIVVLDATTFYAESGGQTGDRGFISTPSGTFEVSSTRFIAPKLIGHQGVVVAGEVRAGQEAGSKVDAEHRSGVMQSHTATHVLHWTLQKLLGEHARQKGSLVEPGRLRFDFSHYEAVDVDLLHQMEEEVNKRVLFDDSVRAFETTFEYAKSLGAMALFGEKYGDVVRVVEVGEYSKELCGGTHVAHTGEIGVVKIVTEGSVAAGTRRIEALTGMAGLSYLNAQVSRLKQAALLLKVEPELVVNKIEKNLETIRTLEAELNRQKRSQQVSQADALLAAATDSNGVQVVSTRIDRMKVDEMRKLAAALRQKMGSGIVLLASSGGESANIVVAVTLDLVERGLSANDIVKVAAGVLGGGGGGPSDLAVAGGSKAELLDEALGKANAHLSGILAAL